MINLFSGTILLSIWCVTLFFDKTIGLSMLLFIVPLTYFLIYLLEKNNKIANKKAKILIIPITLLASTYFIYNNAFFNSINILIIPILVIIMIWRLFNEELQFNFEIIKNLLQMFFMPFNFIGEAFEKLREEIENKFNINLETKRNYKIKKIVKAFFIIIPIVLIILFLLSTADEVFGNLFTEVLKFIGNIIDKIQISDVIIRIILTGITFLYLLGFFYYIAKIREKEFENKNNEIKKQDDFTIKILLAILNIIYFVFCIIQIKSLFMRNVNINYAQYARQGFFQLMIVSIINIITILISKKNRKIKEGNEKSKNKYINYMCLLMIVFTFIIIISAAYRMYLYESAYGYTLLRLLVYCSLFAESILLIPTIEYVLDKNINLFKKYFYIIITIYVTMNLSNFDNIIAKRNVDRYINTGKIDIYYLEQNTSTDAINQIVKILKSKDTTDSCKQEVEEYLINLYNELNSEEMDFRDFNISKVFAKKVINGK